jgi:hypothetical protein
VHTAVFLEGFKQAEPCPIRRIRRNMEASESTTGFRTAAFALWMVMTSRNVLPSSQPFWSARLKRMRRMPWGVKFEAACGAKLTLRRSVT